ncbi:MAG TPA: FecR domain-containing protein [Usitatibacter sp.]|nr:FecR domain-containing protein [Usitatibacter sp.]
MRKALLAAALCTVLATGALAQNRVEAVQYPAWLERGGQVVPLAPGTTLQPSDGIRTGQNARVRLRLAEGSAVKLGENARFAIDASTERGGTFRSAMAVIAGAFRFTSAQARKRDIAIRVKNVTVGIRGTDLWGKAAADRDFVVLIEGRITMESEGHPQVVLDKPLDTYQRTGSAPPEVRRIDARQLEEYARETEIATQGGAAQPQGEWRVVAAVFAERDPALAFSRSLRAAGYPAEIAAGEGKFAVQVNRMASEADARALMANLRGLQGVTLPHVKQGR